MYNNIILLYIQSIIRKAIYIHLVTMVKTQYKKISALHFVRQLEYVFAEHYSICRKLALSRMLLSLSHTMCVAYVHTQVQSVIKSLSLDSIDSRGAVCHLKIALSLQTKAQLTPSLHIDFESVIFHLACNA